MAFAAGVGPFVSLLFPLLFLGPAGGLTLPLGIPPAAQDPVMQQAAPLQCLAYVTWAGTAQPNPKSSNQTEQLLAEEEMRQFGTALMQTIEQAIGKNAEKERPAAAELSKEAIGWAKTVLTHAGAVYVSKFDVSKFQVKRVSESTTDDDFQVTSLASGQIDIRAGAVLDLGTAAATIRGQQEKHQQQAPPGMVKPVKVAGLDGYRLQRSPEKPLIAWTTKGNYLVVGVGEGELEAVLARWGNRPPAWLGAIGAQVPMQRRSMLTYLNVKEIVKQFGPLGGPRVVEILKALGVEGLKGIVSVSGLDVEGMVSKTLLQMDSPLPGIFKLAEMHGLTAGELAIIPRDATMAVAARIDAEKVFDTVTGIVGQIDSQAKQAVDAAIKAFEKQLGIQVHEDLLRPLGDVVSLYSSPSEGSGAFFGITAVLSVRDAKRLAVAYNALMAAAPRALEACGGKGKGARIEKSQFAGREIYHLAISQPGFPVSPSWCLTDKELMVGLFPQSVKACLGRSTSAASLARVPQVAAVFAGGRAPLKIVYQDTPELVKSFYPGVQMMVPMFSGELEKEGIHFDVANLPSLGTLVKHLRPNTMAVMRTSAGIEIDGHGTLPLPSLAAPVAVALVLPAIAATRTAVEATRSRARRMKSMNNLYQIIFAALSYEGARRAFPPAYSADKAGKPLLSWRVLVLPQLDQGALYRQFHLDEPWDSPHNRTLIVKMPHLFVSPEDPAEAGKTRFLSIRGEKTVFPGAKGVPMAEITDGAGSTIAVVEAARSAAVIWTKPDDFEPDPKQPSKGLVAAGRAGFCAAFVDGHCQIIPADVDAKTLKALFTRNGGEKVDLPEEWHGHVHVQFLHDFQVR